MKELLLERLRKIIGVPQMKWDLTMMMFQKQSEQHMNMLWEHILHDKEPGISKQKYADCDVIVSLTTFGKRLWDVAFAIESIMQQTMKANRIVLWLAHEDYKHIPQALRLLQKRGLEINECDDLLSYKKIIPSLKNFPNDVIITIDDDCFYHPDVLERLIEAYIQAPQYIHCLRANQYRFKENGELYPYDEWTWSISKPGPNKLNFFIGCGGVLYPPRCLYEEVLDENVFMEISRYADDVWLNAMAIKKGTLISKVQTRSIDGSDFISNENVQGEGLYLSTNKNRNDEQINKVFAKYSLLEIIKG